MPRCGKAIFRKRAPTEYICIRREGPPIGRYTFRHKRDNCVLVSEREVETVGTAERMRLYIKEYTVPIYRDGVFFVAAALHKSYFSTIIGIGMKSQLREQALNFRIKEELSYSEIRKRLGVSKSTLSYWLRELPLSEEKILELRRKGWKAGEASRERFRTTMRKKRESAAQEIYEQQRKRLSDLSRDTFFVAGLMLYLGEGEKKTTSRMALVNTDPRIIKFFIKWMMEFLDIDKDAMRSQLQLYENMDLEAEKRFWQTTTGFSASQFYKSYIHKLRPASFSYKESYRHGTCGIFYSSVKKKTELMMAIRAFLDLYME